MSMDTVDVQLNELASLIHATAVGKGFWEKWRPSQIDLWLGEKLALAHSELSEALDAERTVDNDEIRQHDILEELADCVIRCLDMAYVVAAQGTGADFGHILVEKVRANTGRPVHHGKRW